MADLGSKSSSQNEGNLPSKASSQPNNEQQVSTKQESLSTSKYQVLGKFTQKVMQEKGIPTEKTLE
jgi:hypothetical protein